jgi:hypothetical protein
VHYLFQAFLGSNYFGVPFALKLHCSDDIMISTLACRKNWMVWPVPPPDATAHPKTTCLKPLAQFLVAPGLKRVRVFNKKGSVWRKKAGAVQGAKQSDVGALNITFDAVQDFMHFGSSQKRQRKLRQALVKQCTALSLLPPIFHGALEDCPSWNP